MIRLALTCAFLLLTTFVRASDERPSANPSFEYDVVRTHELKPHRRTIPVKGAQPGFNQIHLKITVSPTGDVLDVHPSVEVDPPSYAERTLKFWPQLESEVRQWKFIPFEKNGNPVTAEIEEFIDLVPPERLPERHVVPPVIHRDSKVSISLERTGCFGSCPSYTVTLTTEGIVFEGAGYVVASGKHTAKADATAVRKLGERFETSDFYSMDAKYVANVTDNPGYIIAISIDGHDKKIEDYVGSWEGMPAVISDLEDVVDALADTKRWIDGSEGLVSALQSERFDFQSFEAQVMLKKAAGRGQSETVRELVAAGVPLDPLPAPQTKDLGTGPNFAAVGLLTPASGNVETLQILLDAGASRNDQSDKDLALAGAARAGNLEAVRALIAYGANPNAILSRLTVTDGGTGMTFQRQGPGSVLIEAAESGNPEVVKEVLRYHPKLEARDNQGKTAMFALGRWRNSDKEGARVECVRLLAQAGADVNARDKDGDTPLHEIYLTDVEEELLRLGADVNARNDHGETPIFTNNNDSISLFIEHGADLNVRNNKGQTIVEAAKEQGPARVEALRKALQSLVK